MTVKFTEDVTKLLRDLGATDVDFDSIAATVQEIPRGQNDYDTSDNAISVGGLYISFLRNWKSGEIVIMTNDEARQLDEYHITKQPGQDQEGDPEA